MPMKQKYKKILDSMIEEYGKEKGTKIFYSWVNKENIEPDVKAYYFTTLSLKSLEDDVVEGAFATGDPDAYNDILTENCLEDMVEQLKALNITIDDNHESFKNVPEEEKFRSVNPLAKVVNAVRDGVKINVKCVLNKANQRYEEIKSSIKNGFLHSFSFAFIPIETKSVSIDGVKHRIVNKVRLLNGCFTGIPVNPKATFSNVVLKSIKDFEYDDFKVNEIIRGVEMTEDKEKQVEEPKAEPVVEEPKAEESAKVDSSAEVKSLVEKVEVLEKSIEELKAKDKKEEDDKEKDSKVEEKSKIDILEKEIAELKAKLEEPQMKARVEPIKTEGEQEETKSKGPLDLIN
jgi:hypothetical protein